MMIYQVPKEVYDDFINYLKSKCMFFAKTKEFTPIGQWCLVKVCSSRAKLEAANSYLDEIISKI